MSFCCTLGFVLFEIPNMYAVYVIIYVLKIGKRFFRMFENWFLECDEDMQTTGLHATGCIIIFSINILQIF